MRIYTFYVLHFIVVFCSAQCSHKGTCKGNNHCLDDQTAPSKETMTPPAPLENYLKNLYKINDSENLKRKIEGLQTLHIDEHIHSIDILSNAKKLEYIYIKSVSSSLKALLNLKALNIVNLPLANREVCQSKNPPPGVLKECQRTTKLLGKEIFFALEPNEDKIFHKHNKTLSMADVFSFFKRNGHFELVGSQVNHSGFLGLGAEGRVFLVRGLADQKIYAAKFVMSKHPLLSGKFSPEAPKLDQVIFDTTKIVFNRQIFGPFELMPYISGETVGEWIGSNRLFLNTEEAKLAKTKLVDFIKLMIEKRYNLRDLHPNNLAYSDSQKVWLAFDPGSVQRKPTQCQAFKAFHTRFLAETGKKYWARDAIFVNLNIKEIVRENFSGFVKNLEEVTFKECKNADS